MRKRQRKKLRKARAWWVVSEVDDPYLGRVFPSWRPGLALTLSQESLSDTLLAFGIQPSTTDLAPD